MGEFEDKGMRYYLKRGGTAYGEPPMPRLLRKFKMPALPIHKLCSDGRYVNFGQFVTAGGKLVDSTCSGRGCGRKVGEGNVVFYIPPCEGKGMVVYCRVCGMAADMDQRQKARRA